MQITHLFGISVSKHSQRNFNPIPFFYLFPCCNWVLLCTVTSPNCWLYKHINYYLIKLIPSMFPATTHTFQPHVPKIKTSCMLIWNQPLPNLTTMSYSTINSHSSVIIHNAKIITYFHSSTYQLSQHIYINTIILKQDHSSCNFTDTYSYHAIKQNI